MTGIFAILNTSDRYMELSIKQKELLIKFHELLVYGDSKLRATELNYKKLRTKKQVLYFMMGATQSYAESILRLVQPPSIYDKAAEVLMRSIIETLINLDYVYASRTQQNALSFMIYSTKDQIDFAKRHKKFMKKYPSWNLEFGYIKNPEDWDEFLRNKEKEIKLGERYFKKSFSDKFPNIRKRAETADNYLESKGKLTEGKSLEKYYVLYYKYFSQVAHLTMPGLERFTSYDENNHLRFDLDGKPDDIDRVVSVTYIIYFAILRFFLKEFKIFNKVEFEQFSKKIDK